MLADACALRALLPQVVPGRQVGQAGAAGGGRLQGQVDRPGPHSEPVNYSPLCRQRAAWLLGRFAGRLLSCARARARQAQRLGETRASTGHAWSRHRRAHDDTKAAPRRRSFRRREVRASVPFGCTAAGVDSPAAMRRLLAAGAAA